MPGDHKPQDADSAAVIGRVRRMMLVIMTATFVAIGVVFIIIGYRLFRGKESSPVFADVTDTLPSGAKVVSTAVGADHIVVTIDVNGAIEIRTFDPDTLKPLGRLQFKAQ
jgi:hypothetical protein